MLNSSVIILILSLSHLITCFASELLKQEVNSEDDNLQKEHRISNVKLASNDFENNKSYSKDNENNGGGFQDSGQFVSDKANKNKHLDKSFTSDENFQHNDGESSFDRNNKEAHRKGHHKKGFHNTYYKDEKGSNSSYYDDSDDEGDEYLHNSRKNQFDNKHSNNNQGSHLDGRFNSNENSRRGQYDTSGNYEKDLGNRQQYNRENYYDNQKDYRNFNRGNKYDYNDDQKLLLYYRRPEYFEKPRYYDYQRQYHPPKKTITIYEDPRYFDENGDKPHRTFQPFRNDYSVQLDIRPPFRTRNSHSYDNDRVDYY